MTLDELFEKYHEAWTAVARQTDGDRQSAGRAGVTAIVRALRDELSKCDWDEGENMIDALDEILDSDAGEKVAGGSTREDEQSCNSSDGSSPATDAAPAVCEWRGSKDGQLAYMGCTKRLEWTYDRRKCPSCGKSITFTEANHG